MVEADFSGKYLNAENSQNNDIGEIIGEGNHQEMEGKGKVLNLPIRVNGKELTYTPSMQSGKKLVKAWGKETSNWIGKKITIQHVNYKSFGQVKTGIEVEPLL